MIDYFKRIKPIKPLMRPIVNIYNIFANHISNIKSHLLKTSNVNFYLIKITIPYMINTYIEYRYSIASDWISRKRIIITSGPSCI